MHRSSAVLLLVVICSLVNTANTFSCGCATRRSSVSGSILRATSTSDEDEIKALYAKAQQEDAEWLRRVFDENTFPLPVTKAGNGNSRIPPEDIVSADTIDTKEMKQLFALGYSPMDVENIKESVLTVIIDKAVNRPKKGLPESWLKSNANSDSDQANNEDNRRPSMVPNPTTGRNMKRMSPKDGIGEAFAWSGRPPTREEEERGRRLREEDIRNRQSRWDGRDDDREDERAQERREWIDDREDEGPTPFWPDADEFKRMLIDESQWRAGIIGGWSKPFIKAETKWRYKLYKSWLQFLDEGLGDGFDVVADGFQDYYDEEYGGSEEEDFRGGDRGDREEGASARQPRRPEQTVRMSKADAYDRWVDSRVGAEGDWVDSTSEERRARSEMRAAVARREREEAEEEFRGRRSSRVQGQGQGRRDFEMDDYDEEEPQREQWGRGSWLDDSAGDGVEEDDRPRTTRDKAPPRGRASRSMDAPYRSRDREVEINSEEEYRQAWQRSAARAPMPVNDKDLP